MRIPLVRIANLALGAAFFGLSSSAYAQSSALAGAVRGYSTIYSIGVEWDVTGDDDHDAKVAVRYRVQGTSAWRDALPLVRVAAYSQNMLAGSVLFLQAGSTYDIELTLSDPDGGAETRTTSVTTRRLPVRPAGGRTFHVTTGTGGGTGTQADPFRGFAAAQQAARPGDTFLVHAGTFTGRVVFDVAGAANNYIAWVGAGDGKVNLQGGIDVSASHLWFEGLTVENGPFSALVTGNAPDDVVVTRCQFLNNDQALDINSGGSNWYIADNVIVGNSPPESESFSGEGVELKRTSGHTIAHNSITRVADGCSYPGINVDFFGNDIFDTSDDGIETDEGRANVRVWANRIHNVGHNAFTFQPQNGAPWYFIRNQVISYREDTLKFRTTFDRFVFLHNTIVNGSGIFNVRADGMAYAISRNNLWVSVNGGRIWNIGPALDWRTDLDYDGFDWGSSSNPFNAGGTNYASVTAFAAATGQETHGVVIAKASCFDTLAYPGPPPTTIPPQTLTLKAGCAAIDKGVVLPNINDGFSGSAPDLGAYELGQAPPHYGPRPPGSTGGSGGAGGSAGAGGAGGSAGAGTGGATGGAGTGGAAGAGATNGAGGSGAVGGSAAGGSAGRGGSGPGSGGSGKGAPSSAEDDGGCGCRLGAESNARGALLLGLLLVAQLTRRRRRGPAQ